MVLSFLFSWDFDHALSNAPSPFSTAVRRLFQTEEKTNNLGIVDIEEDIE
jgi:hypothetical protein